MDLQSNFMRERNFRRLVLGILSLLTLFIIWAGIQELQTLHSVFDESIAAGDPESSVEIGNLKLSKTSLTRDNQPQTVRYVTVKDLTCTPSEEEKSKILRANNGLTKMMGLMGHPSFLIGEDEGFWESQFYFEFAFHFGGWLVISIFFIVITVINLRQQ